MNMFNSVDPSISVVNPDVVNIHLATDPNNVICKAAIIDIEPDGSFIHVLPIFATETIVFKYEAARSRYEHWARGGPTFCFKYDPI